MLRVRALSVCAVVVLSACGSAAWAQVTVQASLVGRVLDSTGAVVAGATVRLSGPPAFTVPDMDTDSRGRFSFSSVPPGEYTLTVERTGFRSVVRRGIAIAVGEVAAADVTLEVGAVSDNITVVAPAAPIQTQTTEISVVVDGARLRQLPLNGKNFLQLVTLAPGVGTTAAINNPVVAGSRAVSNTFAIDGGTASDERTPQGIANYGGASGTTDAAPSLVPTEALQEFRVITSNADATFGRGSGAQVNVVTRSGASVFSGSGYGFVRNDRLDARDFFNTGGPFVDADGHAQVPPFKQGLYGVSAGGPIVKGGSGRQVFFANYEGFRQRKRLQSSTNQVVPNAALIGLMPPDLQRLYRAFFIDRGLVPATGNPDGTLSPLSATERSRAIAGGFPVALFDGNLANGEAGTVLTQTAPRSDVDQDALVVRTDHRVDDSIGLSFRMIRNQSRQIATPNPGFPIDLQEVRPRWTSVMANGNAILSPHQLLDVRVSLQVARYDSGPVGGTDPQLVAVGVSPQAGLRVVGTGTGLTDLFVYQGAGFLDNQTNPQLSVLHTFNRGALTVRSGADVRWIRADVANYSASVPNYTFQGFIGPTGLLGAAPGQATAVSSSASIGTVFGLSNSSATALRQWRSLHQEYFGQADWRVMPQLTVNAGLRYSVFGAYTEEDGAISNLYATDAAGNVDPTAPLLSNGLIRTGLQTLREQPFYSTDRNNLQPRVGVAWTIDSAQRNVVRGAFGVYYDRIYQFEFTSNLTNPPFAAAASGANIPFSLSPTPVTAAIAAAPAIFAVDPAIRNPRTDRFDLAFERLVGSATSVTAAYVGARGRDLVRVLTPNGLAGVPQSARPDPRFGFVRVAANASSSDYDALQLILRRRMAAGLMVTAAYTYGRSRDDISFDFQARPTVLNLGANPDVTGVQGGGNQFVPLSGSFDYARSDFDVPHNFTLSYLYGLPFGTGHRFANGGGWASALAGGWSLSGITLVRSGAPVNVTWGSDINDDGDAASDRPALLSGSLSDLYAAGTSRTQYLVTQTQALTVLGIPRPITDPSAAIGRNVLRAPAIINVDLALTKRISLAGRTALQLEANVFNVFNRAQLAAPVAVLSDPRFGQITSTLAGTTPRQMQFGARLTF
jgi:hypothetical protein